jgi:hypothetical protein
MLETGAVPEGLTTTIREGIEAVRGRLAAGDVLRMLALLTQAETSIRRSASARLVVETLLLRWTLMDRTVNLEEVLGAAGSRTTETGSSAGPRRPVPATPVRPDAPTSGLGPRPSVLGREVPHEIAALGASWPDLVLRAKEQSPLLGTILEAVNPVGLDQGVISVQVSGGDAHMVEGLRRQLLAVEELVSGVLGGPHRIRVVEGPSGATGGVSQRPQRLSEDRLRAERLQRLRTMDPALDTAADALDLEIVE